MGFAIATAAILIAWGLEYRKNKARGFDDKGAATFSLGSLRRFKVAGAIVVTMVAALVNCITETRWGVTHLPIAKALNGVTPDPFDLIHSALWGGIAVMLPWRRVKYRVWREM